MKAEIFSFALAWPSLHFCLLLSSLLPPFSCNSREVLNNNWKISKSLSEKTLSLSSRKLTLWKCANKAISRCIHTGNVSELLNFLSSAKVSERSNSLQVIIIIIIVWVLRLSRWELWENKKVSFRVEKVYANLDQCSFNFITSFYKRKSFDNIKDVISSSFNGIKSKQSTPAVERMRIDDKKRSYYRRRCMCVKRWILLRLLITFSNLYIKCFLSEKRFRKWNEKLFHALRDQNNRK